MEPEGVVIVGAGPAGAATALGLARAGVPVTLVERAAFPRRKVCGEYLGAGALRSLEGLGLGEAVRSAAWMLSGIRIAAGGTKVELAFPAPALALRREILDGLILDAACGAGAALVRARVEDLICDRAGRVAGVVLRDEAGEVQHLSARFVVGADGIGSVVARKLNLVRPLGSRPRFALGGHYRDAASGNRYVEMFVDPKAYLAINPLGDGVANVMAVVQKPAVEPWTRMLEMAAPSRVGTRVAVGPLEHRVRRAVAAGALLAGDAAGFLSPFTGQGVMLALRGAERAVRAIRALYVSPHLEAEALGSYELDRLGELRRRGRLAALIEALVGVPLLAKRAAPRLQRSPQLAAMLLDALMGGGEPEAIMRPAVLRRLLA